MGKITNLAEVRETKTVPLGRNDKRKLLSIQ